MSELQSVRDMLAMAESAAAAGDLVSADELLRAVARAQEDALGPLHPDLASTLNNRAILAEKTGRPDDAEKFYRRAFAIASASLSADDPRLAASRQNLEDFRRSRSLPIDAPKVAASPARRKEQEPAPTAIRRPSRAPARAAIGIAVLVIAALLVMKLWSSPEAPNPAPNPTTEPNAPQAVEPVRPQASPPAPIEPARPPTATAREDRSVASNKATALDRPAGAITLASVELCQALSTRGANWKCDPAGNSVAPGQLALYTRVKSPRDTVVVHRWYRGNTLRQSVQLNARANAREGYRTYSRQTVHAGEDWRVEVRSAAGDLLHEQRLSVR